MKVATVMNKNAEGAQFVVDAALDTMGLILPTSSRGRPQIWLIYPLAEARALLPLVWEMQDLRQFPEARMRPGHVDVTFHLVGTNPAFIKIFLPSSTASSIADVLGERLDVLTWGTHDFQLEDTEAFEEALVKSEYVAELIVATGTPGDYIALWQTTLLHVETGVPVEEVVN